ncbi:head GIN domain-containing protein [soil metagenome]
MKKIGIILFLATLAIGLVVSNLFSFGKEASKFFNFSFSVGSVKGSGQTALEVRDIAGFHAIDVGGVFEVKITAQKDFAVEVEADDNLLPLIRTEVRNGVLRIETDRKLSTSNPIRIRVSAPDIDDLDISGAANITVENVKNSELNVDSSGASKIKITGETAKLTVDVSGATKVDAGKLVVENATVEAGGASQVTVQVSGELRTKASGASRINYSGTPTNVINRTTGAASVTGN